MKVKKSFTLRLAYVFTLAGIMLFLGAISPPPAFSKNPTSQQIIQALEDAFVDIADRMKPTVVNISPAVRGPARSGKGFKGRPHGESGSGSGLIVDKKGYIVTNNHVVGEATQVEVRLSDKRHFTGTVIGKDPDTDIAVIKIDAKKDLPYVPMGDSSKVRVGQWVIAVGNPFGLDRTVTVGVVSATGRENVNLSRYENFIQTDASINPGNSGGPLFNIKGEVIGINTAIINYAQGIGFAIPSNMVKHVVDQLISKGRVVRGWLGVGIQPVTADLASKFNVKEGQGVLINEVFEGDPAAKAGVRPGDIIIKLNDEVIDTPQSLSRFIASLDPGKDAKLVIMRDGKKKTIAVRLGEREETAITASIPHRQENLLGLTVKDLTEEMIEQFKLSDDKGVLITKVESGSVAEKEGVREGDLIKEINRKTIDSSADYEKAVKATKKGESVLMRIIREKRAFYVVLKIQPK